MANPVRGDDDVLALLNEMTGASARPSSPNGIHQQQPSPDRSNSGGDGTTAAASSSTIIHNHRPSSLSAATLAASHRLSPPSNPHVEIIRHRCHEKFKSSFYDLFRSCASNNGTLSSPSSNNNKANAVGPERNLCIRSTIHSVWKSMPPHSVWERFQFSLKTLEGDCVRETIQNNEFMPPWCCHEENDSEQLLDQLVCPTVHQIHKWIVSGRCCGTVWEPLLPVPFISSFSKDSTNELQRVNQRYRQGTFALLQEEMKFQFRRTFKQQLGRHGGGKQHYAKGNDQLTMSIDKLFAFLNDADEAASSTNASMSNVKIKTKKSKKEKKKNRRSCRDEKQNATDEHSITNKEEYILQTIFQSHSFQKLTQKLHKKFHHLAEEVYSAFLSELQKCSNRFILEEQSQLGGGGRNNRKRKNGSYVPKITFVENNDDCRFSGSGNVDSRDDQVMVTFAGIALRINEMHKSKLHYLYRRMLRNMLCHEDDRFERYLRQFSKLLFTILLRYDALEGSGLQSAIPPTVFRYLHKRFGCELECFASPFNCWSEKSDNGGRVTGGNYGSVFGDTDALFGSIGGFFEMDFLKIAKKSGGACFQANPPFASEFIERMCHRMHQFLDISNHCGEDGANADAQERSSPLMFVIFVPAWSESPGWKTLSSSPHLKKHILLSQKDDVHYYAEGTQHRRAMDDKGGHRVASFDTSVFFLQNHAAREKWSLLGDVDNIMLKTAFAMNSHNNIDGKGDAHREDSTQVRKNEQSDKKHLKNDPISPLPKRKRKKKRVDGKTKATLKKKKMISGPNDEMNILASLGILDKEPPSEGGNPPEDETVEQNNDDGSSKKKKRRFN